MSIATLSELKAAMRSISNRGTADDDYIPTAIRLNEARMSRDLKVRSLEQRANATLTAGDAYTLLPSDLRAIRGVKILSSPIRVLEYVTPDSMDVAYPLGESAVPKCFAVIGGEIRWGPVPDAAYTAEIVYSAGIDPLSGDSSTNTILLRHPDAYLCGSLWELFDYLEDEKNAAKWQAKYGAAVAGINKAEEASRYGGIMRARAV